MLKKRHYLHLHVLGARLRQSRLGLGWSQEKLGVQIGLDESCSRARISRYESGVHEPPIAISRLLADQLDVPLAYLYCDDEDVAELLLKLSQLPGDKRKAAIAAVTQALNRDDEDEDQEQGRSKTRYLINAP